MNKTGIIILTFIVTIALQVIFICYHPYYLDFFSHIGLIILVTMFSLTTTGFVASFFPTNEEIAEKEDKKKKYMISNKGRIYFD